MKYIVAPKLTKLLSLVIDIHCITIWPIVLCSSTPTEGDKQHEEIHGHQWREIFNTLGWITLPTLLLLCLALPVHIGLLLVSLQLVINWLAFPAIYGAFYIRNYLRTTGKNRAAEAYYDIPFELEAYAHTGPRPYMNWTNYM